MAEPWIKMRCNLADDEAVIGIASAIKADADTVVGKLHRLWSWADRQSRDGHIRNVTAEWIDGHVGALGFAAAMVNEHWLVLENGGVTFPKFNEHMSGLAKKRAFDTKRQSRFRHTKRVTRALPDRDRDRDSKKSTSSSRKRDPIWDVIAEIWFQSGVSETQKTRVGKLIRDFKAKKDVTADEIQRRHAIMVKAWGDLKSGPEALEKWWDRFDGKAQPPSRPGRAEAPPGKYAGR